MEERNIEIDRSQNTFVFTKGWFRKRNQKTWSTYFPDRFDKNKPMNMLQIGVWEGMDLVWCLQNILCHPDSRVIAIDPWLTMDYKHTQEDMNHVRERAIGNLRPWDDKVKVIHNTSQAYLPTIINQGAVVGGTKLGAYKFDLAVIDGCHDAPAVYDDAVNCVQLVKLGGWMVFDDVRNRIYKKNHVIHGIEKFLKDYGERVEKVWEHEHCNCYVKVD